jgi:hypothetical protein
MTAMLIPHCAVGARRLHDTNRSGWWLLISLTVIGIIPILIWLASKGSNKSNKYGEPISNSEVLNSINSFKVDSEKNEKSDEIANIEASSWNQAIDEFEGEARNRGLYAKLFAETQGDESKVKARYIDIRAKEIQSSKTPDVSSSLITSKESNNPSLSSEEHTNSQKEIYLKLNKETLDSTNLVFKDKNTLKIIILCILVGVIGISYFSYSIFFKSSDGNSFISKITSKIISAPISREPKDKDSIRQIKLTDDYILPCTPNFNDGKGGMCNELIFSKGVNNSDQCDMYWANGFMYIDNKKHLNAQIGHANCRENSNTFTIQNHNNQLQTDNESKWKTPIGLFMEYKFIDNKIILEIANVERSNNKDQDFKLTDLHLRFHKDEGELEWKIIETHNYSDATGFNWGQFDPDVKFTQYLGDTKKINEISKSILPCELNLKNTTKDNKSHWKQLAITQDCLHNAMEIRKILSSQVTPISIKSPDLPKPTESLKDKHETTQAKYSKVWCLNQSLRFKGDEILDNLYVENWKKGNPEAAQNQRFLILKQSNKNITNIYSGVFDNRIGNWSKKLEKENNIIKYIGMDGTPSELHHNKSLFSESYDLYESYRNRVTKFNCTIVPKS